MSTSNDMLNDELVSSLPGAAISTVTTLVALPRGAGLELIVVAGFVLLIPLFVTTPALASNNGSTAESAWPWRLLRAISRRLELWGTTHA